MIMTMCEFKYVCIADLQSTAFGAQGWIWIMVDGSRFDFRYLFFK